MLYFSIFARINFTNNYLNIIYSHIILSLFRLKGLLWHPELVQIAIINIQLKIIFFELVHFVLSRAGIVLIAMLYFVLTQKWGMILSVIFCTGLFVFDYFNNQCGLTPTFLITFIATRDY